MRGRRSTLLALRRRLPALARLVGLTVHDLGKASLVVTARPSLDVQHLSAGAWLVNDPTHGGGRKTAAWQHVPITPHAHLLINPRMAAPDLGTVANVLYTRYSALHTSAIVERLGIGCVIEGQAESDDIPVALRNAGYGGVIVSLAPDPTVADALAKRAAGDDKWHVVRGILGDRSDAAAPVPVQRLDTVLDTVVQDHPRLLLDLHRADDYTDVLAGAGQLLADIAVMKAKVPAEPANGLPQLDAAIAKLEATTGLAVAGLFPSRCEQSTGRTLEFTVWLARPGFATSALTGVLAEGSATSGLHAEVAEVWARDETVSIVFDIEGLREVGADAAVDAVILRSRHRSAHQRHAVRTDDRRLLRTDIPIRGLDPLSRPVNEIWDVYAAATLNGEDRVELRMGKHLDDIVGKKRIITFPTQRPATDESFAVTPYYTLHDNLSIRCRGTARKG